MSLAKTNYYAFNVDDEEWGDDEEWEWESEGEEEDQEIPEPFTNGISKTEINNKPNLTAAEKLQNGINITITNHMNGVHDDEDDDKPVDANGKADIKIQGNLLTINRNGQTDWSDDEYEESPAPAPPPPPPPPPPPKSPVPPPPPPPPSNNLKLPTGKCRLETLCKDC